MEECYPCEPSLSLDTLTVLADLFLRSSTFLGDGLSSSGVGSLKVCAKGILILILSPIHSFRALFEFYIRQSDCLDSTILFSLNPTQHSTLLLITNNQENNTLTCTYTNINTFIFAAKPSRPFIFSFFFFVSREINRVSLSL
ncbi:hypothetical protein Pst134EB_002370 [Puccinia striiformis f. sp. tritici]|nr:hypothetical protein Pst134EB_002370 [Puccinia striiformis f. sp. tritici]